MYVLQLVISDGSRPKPGARNFSRAGLLEKPGLGSGLQGRDQDQARPKSDFQSLARSTILGPNPSLLMMHHPLALPKLANRVVST